MYSKKMTWLMIGVFTFIGSWIGEAIGHSWFGWWSNILSILFIPVGIWAAVMIENYING